MTDSSTKTSLTYNLARAHRYVHTQLEAKLQRDGMSVEQWRVLHRLAETNGQSMGSLARHVLMNHPALTKLADRMVANGLIDRISDPEDQRRVLVHITDEGRTSLERVTRTVEDHDRSLEQIFGHSKSAALTALLEDLSDEMLDDKPVRGRKARGAGEVA
ncbi:MAG: MarR family transcriptional regulator [Pseudomonadota bacterium]